MRRLALSARRFEKYGGLKTFTDYKPLLEGVPVDAVIVATPSRSHGEIVRAALERGIHVFCEKPFCLDPEEGKRLAELADSKALVNMVGYHYRSIGTFQEAKRLLSLGAIGKVHHVRAEAYGPVVLRAKKGSTWRTTKVEGGGCLHDYASHAIDLLNYLVGPPSAVRGSVLNSIFSRDVDDEVYSTLLYQGGMTGQLAANWSDESHRKMTMKITLWGERAASPPTARRFRSINRGSEAEAKTLGLEEGWTVKYTTELTEPVWYYLRGEEYSSQIDNFVQRIKGRPARGNEATFLAAIDTD